MTGPLLSVRDLRKNYGGVKALQGASLDVYAGEIHALLGENGTGKSTLMRTLAGVERPDDGVIAIDGRTVELSSTTQAQEAGISIVFQELSLFGDLDILANLFAGREYTRRRLVDRKAMRSRALPVVQRLGLTASLNTQVADLSLAERQLVEIAKALINDARLLILDEPNSALNAAESERLFSVIRDLKADDVAIIYISHRLEEVFALADRVSVMRGGRIIETNPINRITMSSVVAAMLGRAAAKSEAQQRAPRSADAPVAIRLEGITVAGQLDDVSLEVNQGEVVGLVGLEGAGQREVLRTIFGDAVPRSGRMEMSGRAWAPKTPRQAALAGVAFVPADRTRAGLMMTRSIGDNIAQVRMATVAPAMYRYADLHHRGEGRVAELGIRTSSTYLPVNALSGGNQQKVVLAKWLEVNPRVLLLDDPTRGVDVGGKAEIYELITRLAREGVTVLFTSTEFVEFQAVCGRVIVFRSGRVTGQLDADAATEHALAEAVNSGHRAPETVATSVR